MTGPLLGQGFGDDDETTPTTKESDKECLSALRLLVKEHNSRGNVLQIRLNFDEDKDDTRIRTIVTGKEIWDADLKKPFKETVKTPLTRRIIEFACPEFKMPTNVQLYDGTTDLEDHLSRFASTANSGEWPMSVWCRMFQQTLDGNARGWFERLLAGSIDEWAELRKQFTTRFSTRRACFKHPIEITKIVRKANETLVAFKEIWIVETGFILDMAEIMKISSFMDAHKSEEAFANSKLLKGEVSEASKKVLGPISRREDRFHRGGYGVDRQRNDGQNTFNNRDGLAPYQPQAPYQAPRGDHPGHHHPRLNMSLFTKHPKEILASKLQLNLPPPRPLQLPPKKESQNRGRDGGKDKVINMIRSWPDEKKRKSMESEEIWKSVPITFLSVSSKDESDEPIIVEAEPYNKVSNEKHTNRSSRFIGDVVKPVGKIELEDWVKNPSGHSFFDTLHGEVSTPIGIATLVTRTVIISECTRLEKKQMIDKEALWKIALAKETEPSEVSLTEETLVNPAYLEWLVTIEGNLSKGCKDQLRNLLKKNMDVFPWEPSDMMGVPRRIIEHSLNTNLMIESFFQKRRVLAPNRSQAVIKEVEEWLRVVCHLGLGFGLYLHCMIVPTCYVIFDLEPLSLSFNLVFSFEISKSFLVCLCRLCHLAILCLDQHAHNVHHLESLLTISLNNLCLDNLDIFKKDLEY
ncbi:hypothetical protein Tco_0935560 [Tanacetum coccineum]